ncbi:TPA: tetratricopeptide repeat protein [Legionella pneumophila]
MIQTQSNESERDCYLNEGLRLISEQKYKDAILEFNKALDLSPKYLKALIQRGCCYLFSGEYQKSVTDLEEAKQLDLKHYGIYYHLAMSYFNLNQYEKASKNITEAINLLPNNSTYLIWQQRINEKLKKLTMYQWPEDIETNPNCRESTTGYNWTPLHAAVHHGNAHLVADLLNNGAVVVKDARGILPNEVELWSELQDHNESVSGYKAAQKYIKELHIIKPGTGIDGAGAMYQWTDDILSNPNCRESNTGYNWTPLHAAVHHGDAWLVAYLINHGAILVRDARGRLPNEVALWPQLLEFNESIEGYKLSQKYIQELHINNPGTGIDGVGAMYQWGDDMLSNPNCRELNTGYKWTPLHAAVHHGDSWLVSYLLSHGAVAVRDVRGRLPQDVPLWPQLEINNECQNSYQRAVQIMQEIPEYIISSIPTQKSHHKHKHRHGLKKVLHKVSKVLDAPIHITDTIIAPIVKPINQVTGKITHPITKVTYPVLKPVVKVLEPVNSVLLPINTVLTPISVVTTGGTLESAILATAKEHVFDKITKPLTESVNHFVNPVDALICDATKPLSPILSTMGSVLCLASQLETIGSQERQELGSETKSENKETLTNKKEHNQQRVGNENSHPPKSQEQLYLDYLDKTQQPRVSPMNTESPSNSTVTNTITSKQKHKSNSQPKETESKSMGQKKEINPESQHSSTTQILKLIGTDSRIQKPVVTGTPQIFKGLYDISCTQHEILKAANAMNDLDEQYGIATQLINGQRKDIKWGCAPEHIQAPQGEKETINKL